MVLSRLEMWAFSLGKSNFDAFKKATILGANVTQARLFVGQVNGALKSNSDAFKKVTFVGAPPPVPVFPSTKSISEFLAFKIHYGHFGLCFYVMQWNDAAKAGKVGHSVLCLGKSNPDTFKKATFLGSDTTPARFFISRVNFWVYILQDSCWSFCVILPTDTIKWRSQVRFQCLRKSRFSWGTHAMLSINQVQSCKVHFGRFGFCFTPMPAFHQPNSVMQGSFWLFWVLF